MENQNNTPQSKKTDIFDLDVDPGLLEEAAQELSDEEYLESLEDLVEFLQTTNNYGHEAIQTFVELLEFIGDNFGDTADFPVRIDSDFYKDVFLEKLNNCTEKLNQFLQRHGEEFLDEDQE